MSKPTRYYSKKQEKNVARTVSGRISPNSGATAFSKGDVSNDLFLIECKTKTSRSTSIQLKKEWFDKLSEESFAMGKPYYTLAFDFGDGDTQYVIGEKLFKKLLKYMEEENGLDI